MQLLFLQGKAAMTYNGTWMLEQIQAGTPTGRHSTCMWRRSRWSTGRSTAHSILAWGGFALAGQGGCEP